MTINFQQKAIICVLVAITCYVIKPRSGVAGIYDSSDDFTRQISFSGHDEMRRYL